MLKNFLRTVLALLFFASLAGCVLLAFLFVHPGGLQSPAGRPISGPQAAGIPGRDAKARQPSQVPASASQPVSVAVFRFPAPDPEDGMSAAPAISDLLVSELAKEDGLRIVERSELDRILDELALPLEQASLPDRAARLGSLSGADVMVLGRVVRSEAGAALVVKVLDARSGVLKDLLTFSSLKGQIETTTAKLKDAALAACRSKGPAQGRTFLAIGGFEDRSINELQVQRGEEIRHFLEQRYSGRHGFSVVQRSQLEPILAEMGLNEAGLSADGAVPGSFQPSFFIVSGSYRLLRQEETLVELSVDVDGVAGSRKTLAAASASWDEVLRQAAQKLDAVVDARPVQPADPRQEAARQLELGRKRLGMKISEDGHGMPFLGGTIGKQFDSELRMFISDEKQAKNIRDAMDHFESAILLDPSCHEAMLFLAVCLDSQEVGESGRAAELFRKVASESSDDRIKFIAARHAGLLEKTTLSPEFSKKVVKERYRAEELCNAFRQAAGGNRSAFIASNPPVEKLEKLFAAHRQCVLASCEYMEWALAQNRQDEVSMFGVAQDFSMRWEEEHLGNPHVARHNASLMAEVQRKHPRIAANFLVFWENAYSGMSLSDQLFKLLQSVEEGKVEPFDQDDFSEGLGRLLETSLVSRKNRDVAVARKIGEHLLRMDALSPKEAVYLAFAYKLLGDVEKGAGILEGLGSERIALPNSKPWGDDDYAVSELLFSPLEERKKWLQSIGKDAGVGASLPEVVLGPPATELPVGQEIAALAMGDDAIWIASADSIYRSDRHAGRLAPVRSLPPGLGRITAIASWRDALWIGSEGGLVELRMTAGTSRRFGVDDGLLNPHIVSLCLKGSRLFVVLKSGFGWMDLEASQQRFHGLITGSDVASAVPSPDGAWALLKDGLMHFDERTGRIAAETAFPKDDDRLFRSIAADGGHVAVGIDTERYRYGGVTRKGWRKGLKNDHGKSGGAIVYQPSSGRTNRIWGGASFVDRSVLALAFAGGRRLIAGGKGYLAVVDLESNAVIAQSRHDGTIFAVLVRDGQGTWVARGRHLHYLPDAQVASLSAKTPAAASVPAAGGEAAGDAGVLDGLRHDGTPGSLRKIQEAVMPAALQGNIVAIVICRQTMHALGQDMELERVTTEMAKLLDAPTMDRWTAAVKGKADQGDPFFETVMGMLLFHGTGVGKNDEESLKHFSRAAKKGYHDALRAMGTMHKLGLLLERDLDKARQFYERAAQAGSASAFYELGCMYNEGNGVPVDKRKAVELWKKSAAMGHAWSQFNVGWSYMNGNGVELDRKEGMRWIRKAAEQGHKRAQSY